MIAPGAVARVMIATRLADFPKRVRGLAALAGGECDSDPFSRLRLPGEAPGSSSSGGTALGCA
jgi:hypothetical protein